MKLAIGVVSPPNYVHSQAFREVAETLEAAAIALGHDVVVSTETNLRSIRRSTRFPAAVRFARGSIAMRLKLRFAPRAT